MAAGDLARIVVVAQGVVVRQAASQMFPQHVLRISPPTHVVVTVTAAFDLVGHVQFYFRIEHAFNFLSLIKTKLHSIGVKFALRPYQI